ncbi:MAG: PQQ-binding-like beta-propeller repeat protein [Rikenellaceae bacterium]
MKKFTKLLLTIPLFSAIAIASCSEQKPIESIETPYTISLVRTADIDNKEYIIASSYEGVVLCYDFNGKKLWENKLSGFFNQDIYCADLDGDGSDDIVAANSNGTLYALDENGKVLWQKSLGETPISALTVVHKDGKPYIAAGAYDTNLYYLDAKGEILSTTPASSYSKEKGFGPGGPEGFTHTPNLMRTLTKSDGSEVMVMQGTPNSMSAKGGVYLFQPLATKPYKYMQLKGMTVAGSISINDTDKSKGDLLMLGSTKDTRAGFITEVDLESSDEITFSAYGLMSSVCGGFGYRVAQCEVMNINSKPQHVMLFGSAIILPTYDNTPATTKGYQTRYSYNDVCKDNTSTKLILASSQSGGSCIHIIDMNNKEWSTAYQNLVPKGKITTILDESAKMREELANFELPSWESPLNERPVVHFMSEGPNRDAKTKAITDKIHANYPSPTFLNGGNSGGSEKPEFWNRDTMKNDFYRTRRDRRQKYANSQEQIIANLKEAYKGNSKGMSMWGGHGNDPFYYSPQTQKKIMDLTGDNQETVLIFPEMEGRGEDVVWLMNNYIYPLANHAREHNTKLFIRSKHVFWLGNVYEHQWSKLVSGEYAATFVPSMEETTDKSMELSLMGRMGVWLSGATDSWGSRCARDNASYNRLRQHSHQNLPTNFLRNMVYHISLGAQYLDNFKVDQEYMSLLWEMIAKGILYVPKREEIVSLNPVRLTMLEPNQDWLNEGNNVKWVCLYNKEREEANPYVMGRLNGTWPAAPTTSWDFSTYAAGAKERRLNFISSFNNGHVIITPPYDANAARGTVEEKLNPIYKGKTKEFFTDGKYYYSDAQKTKQYSPKEYYKVVEDAIEEGTKAMPLTVKGEVGWVAAQSAPNHLRVTVIDGGYVNPTKKDAIIKFGTAKVKSITDLATGENIEFSSDECKVTIPCGLFRFFDIELSEPLSY